MGVRVTLVMNNKRRHREGLPYRNVHVRALLCGALCLAIFHSGCSAPGESPRAEVAVVNGGKIYLRDFKKKLERAIKLSAEGSVLGPADMTRLQEEVLNGLINEKVMLLRAGHLSLSVSDDELMKRIREITKDYSGGSVHEILAAEKIDFAVWREELRIGMLLEKLVQADVNDRISVTEEEAKSYFNAHRNEYTVGQRVHVAQIIVRDKGKAEEILGRLKKGADFGKVAEDVSIGPEAPSGGDLGFFSRGIMPEAIEKAVFSLSPGKISKIVQSPFGYHIFKVLDRDEGGRKSFTEMKGRILADLKRQKEEEAYVDWLTGLRAKVVIKRNEELLKKISLKGGR